MSVEAISDEMRVMVVTLSAFIECLSGMLNKNGCGGTNFISRDTSLFPPFLTVKKHE
jgi:hypothetical protein